MSDLRGRLARLIRLHWDLLWICYFGFVRGWGISHTSIEPPPPPPPPRGFFLGRRFLGRCFLGRRFLGRRFLGRCFLGRRFLGRRSSFSRSSFSRHPLKSKFTLILFCQPVDDWMLLKITKKLSEKMLLNKRKRNPG